MTDFEKAFEPVDLETPIVINLQKTIPHSHIHNQMDKLKTGYILRENLDHILHFRNDTHWYYYYICKNELYEFKIIDEFTLAQTTLYQTRAYNILINKVTPTKYDETIVGRFKHLIDKCKKEYNL